MPVEDRYVKVPPEIESDLERIVPVVLAAAQERNQDIKDSDLELEDASQAKGILAEAVIGVVLYVGARAAETMTEKWLEEIVWPKIKPLLKDKSDPVLDYLLGLAAENERCVAQARSDDNEPG